MQTVHLLFSPVPKFCISLSSSVSNAMEEDVDRVPLSSQFEWACGSLEKELRTEVLTWDYRTEGAWSNNVFSCLCFCKFWLLENHSSKLLSLAIFKVSDLRYFLSFFFPKYWNLVSGNGKKMGIWFLQFKELVLGRGKFCSFEQKS